MSLLILIPARYGSTRFPGKPLALINGKSMLSRVIDVALAAMRGYDDIDLIVASDNEEIMQHAAEHGASAILTPENCKTGTDRAISAVRQLPEYPDQVISLQGDVPLIPVDVVRKMIDTMKKNPHLDVVTPVQNLSWKDLDRLREAKKETPFSGTTVIMDDEERAVWFSKNIIPAIRKEEEVRDEMPTSPVWRHIGLYGYRVDILERFTVLGESLYEKLEGLEQLRLLENNISIQCIPVEIPQGALLSGIDTPQDLARAEAILQQQEAQERPAQSKLA